MNRKIINKAIPILLVLAMALLGGTFLSAEPKEEKAAFPPAAETPLPSPIATPPQTAATPGPEQTKEPEITPEPTPTPTPAPEYFTLNFIGDCTLASVPYYQGSASGYDTVVGSDFAYPFAKTVDYFKDDDMTFANLECCLTDSTDVVAKTFTFKADEDYVNIMSEGSVEFVTLANNHILDYGNEGVADTKAALDSAGIAYAGRDEYTVYETERGLRIGVYAASFATTGMIKSGIEAVKALDVDFIVAALHWGDEGSYTVNTDQKTQAHAAIDAGADFVYGSHPHTLQPIEEYNGHYIYYSMGNWSFGGNTNPRDKDTFILRMTVEKTADGGVSITEREHIPCASSGDANGNNYQPVAYEKDSEGYKRVLAKLDGSFSGSNLSIGYTYSNNE